MVLPILICAKKTLENIHYEMKIISIEKNRVFGMIAPSFLRFERLIL